MKETKHFFPFNTIYRQLFMVCLVFVSFLTISTSAFAADSTAISDISSVSENTPGTSSIITGYSNQDDFQNLPTVSIPQNRESDITPIYYAIFPLLEITATVTLPDGSTDSIPLEVIWDIQMNQSTVNPLVPGTYTERGYVQLPEGNYSWGENVVREFTLPVEIIVPEQPAVINQMDAWSTRYYCFPVDTSIDDILSQIPVKWLTTAEDGSRHNAAVNWDISGIDPSLPGLYSINGTLSPELNTVFADGFTPQLTLFISLQIPDQPQLNCVSITDKTLYFDWILQHMDPETMQVMFAKGEDTPWVQLTNNEHYSISSYGLQLYEACFPAPHTYRLQVLWAGGSTDIHIFTFDPSTDSFTSEGLINGDRDGGDMTGSSATPSPNTMAPDVPKDNHIPDTNNHSAASDTNSPGNTPTASGTTLSESTSSHNDNSTVVISTHNKAAAPADTHAVSQQSDVYQTTVPTNIPGQSETLLPSEDELRASIDYLNHPKSESDTQAVISEHTISLSGAQLLLMIADGQNPYFSNDGITLILPIEIVEKLQIEASDQLVFELKPEDEQSFSFNMMVNGNSSTLPSDVTVMVPFITSSSPSLRLLNHLGDEISSGTYDKENGAAVFQLNQTGRLSIVDYSAGEDTVENQLEETVTILEETVEDTSPALHPLPFIIGTSCITFIVFGIHHLKRKVI